MATHAIGKLKFKLSKEGLDYRWGDGEIKRLFGGRNKAQNDIDDMAYEDEEGYVDPGYDDDADYADDYQDDPGYDDYGDGNDGDAYDDGYADDAGYDDYDADAEYDDGYADDADYDDGYGDYDGDYDDGYDDYAPDGEYDDRYSDEDADEGYEGDDYPEDVSPLTQYVDENDWVTYLLLFMFPPLGIYLLWRRGKFETPIRWAVSAASAVWFVVALILLFSTIFGGAKDASQEATITLAPSATASLTLVGSDDDGGLDVSVDSVGTSDGTDVDSTVAPAATPLGGGSASLEGNDVEPSPTPLTDAASAALSVNAYVYSPATGLYYHSKSDCTNIDEGVSVSRVPREVAENNRKQSACPVCIGAAAGGDTTTYYATPTGDYYHVDQYCQDMQGATTITKEAAERNGKTACPVCILKTQQSTSSGKVKFITSSTTDKSKINVYSTKSGKYYHMTANCSGMSGATRSSLKDALLAGKGACPTCCKAAGASVYCTKDGKYYHLDKKCSGMKNPAETTLAEALVLGKTRCHECVKSGALPTVSQLRQSADAGDDGTYVYGTAKGKYYHTDATCSGMKGAQRYTLKSMLLQKRKPCPKCASAADTVVYCTKSGKYYHSYANCSGMTSATSGTMAEAISEGYKRCPRCWSESTSMSHAHGHADSQAQTTSASASSGSSESTAKIAASASATAKNTYVYATDAGSYYHLKSNCSGMKGANRITLKKAIEDGKKACPTCATSANRKVYSTSNGDHYHAASTCEASGMKNGKERTLAEALMKGQTACKYCIGGKGGSSSSSASSSSSSSSSSASSSEKSESAAKTAETKANAKTVESIKKAAAKLTNSHTYKSGKSGIYVYARADGKYYHRDRSCSGMTNAGKVTLETAMNYGKTACPKCCSSARRTVYATPGGKYYHNSKTHAGSGAKSGSLASALAYGYKACPYCVTKTKTLKHTNTYKSGTSGIKVYATASGKYYHSKSSCSDMENPSHITLETALNYGKKPCPKCMSAAGMKVYSSSGDRYYHYYKAHAGSGAKAGTLAQARALGKKMCSSCAKMYNKGVPASAFSSTESAKKTMKSLEKLAENTKGAAYSYSQAPESKETYAASGDSRVYVDLTGSYFFYYHKSSRCSKTHMSGGTAITLQYAKDWGYKACPYCNPPTSIDDDD